MGYFPGRCSAEVPISSKKAKEIVSKKEVIVKDLSHKQGIAEMEAEKESGPVINYNYLIMGGLGVIILILVLK
tara:strand:- start:759 stop:977 length:219 start_codon:yes stop_codon:yes gene_type:complete